MIADRYSSFSLTPWLFEILWYMPAGRDMHIMMKIAAQMVRVRRNTKDLPGFRDLMSYLVRIRTFSSRAIFDIPMRVRWKVVLRFRTLSATPSSRF